MPQAVDSVTSLVDQLAERLGELESRIAALESVIASAGSASRSKGSPDSKDPYAGPQVSGIPAPAAHLERPPIPAPWRALAGVESSAGAFAILGKAVLGFAGAFLLRAIAESGSVPKLPVLIIAILYACFWMIWSARISDRVASVTYGITSALILCPMLWEATVRFQAMPPLASAAVLVGFVTLTLTFALGRELQLVPWIAILAGVSTGIALIIGTHDLVPLTAALLAIAAATELSFCLGHELTFRAIPAVAADFTIWLLIYILGTQSVPEGYHAASLTTLIVLSALLPGLYIASIAFRVFLKLRRITFFDIGQAAASLALASFGILTVTDNAAAPALGIVLLTFAGICYWGTLSRFAADAHARNRRVCATCAAALSIAGTFLALPATSQIPFLCMAALLATIVYTRTAKLSLGLHASFYLASAAAVSPLAAYVWSALAGTVPGSPHWSAWAVSFAAALCYGLESHYSVDEGRRLLWIVPAGVAAFTISAWTVSAVVRLFAGHLVLAASHLSMIRTIILCALALALGLASRRNHVELRWVAYAAVALGTLKLLLEDLRFGNPASLVVSFVSYGLILILLPHLTRSNQAAGTSGRSG